MAFHYKPLLAIVAVLVVVLGTTTSLAEAQQVQSCASKLVPCANFLNSSSTPDSNCCDGIKEAVANELPCLCSLYNTPGLLASFNVTVAQALQLSQKCGVTTDLTACNNSAGSPTASVPPPPGTAGGDTGSAGRIAWTGISSLLLFWASVMLY